MKQTSGLSRIRIPLLALGLIALAAAGWGGLSRLAIVPAPPGDSVAAHGTLMASGFVGTLIALERAIVIRRAWAGLAALLSGIGALALIAGAPAPVPALVIAAGALVFVAVTGKGAATSPALGIAVMTAGAIAWASGAVALAAGLPAFRVAPWWIAFLVLTVSAERMELSRLLRPSATALAFFVAACATLAAGTASTLVDMALGMRITGAGVLVLAVWLGFRDLAPTVSRRIPLPRYIAFAITLSYSWLALGGALMLTFDGIPAGTRWDALLHAVLVGFVLTMIFAHGPIILPGILGVAVAFRRTLYVPLALLEASVALRMIGDAVAPELRDWSGVLTALAVLAFMATMGSSLRRRRPSGATLPASAGD